MQPPPRPTSDDGTQRPGAPGTQADTAATCADSLPTSGAVSTGRDLQLPLVIGGRYRIEELRGGGGMAKVYRGIDVTLEREVAVKLINPELRSDAEFDARFQREARIASQLADPHIVVVHDFGLDPTHGPFLVMEFLQGLSLRERLTLEGPLPVKAALQLAGQLLLALIHAHDKGIVHRDIKPDNVFLLNQSGVKLHTRILDFGIARIYRDSELTHTAITSAGAVLGTPRYMAPEQLAGQPVDSRTDLYAAGLVVFEAVTGILPYVQQKKLTELCPEATPQLQELLEHCLKPAPADRPASALEVYLRLQELGKASGVLLLPPGALSKLVASRKANEPTVAYLTPPDTGRKRFRLILGALAVVLLLGVFFLGKWLFFSDASFPPGPEGLLGIQIGDSTEIVEQKVSLSRIDQGNPWKLERTREHMGRALTPADLGLADGELSQVKTRSTNDHQTQILFHKDKVVAVITRQRAASSLRHIRIGGDGGNVLRNYDDQRGKFEDIPLETGGHVEVRRYPALGVAFEIQGRRVTGMSLFPPQKP